MKKGDDTVELLELLQSVFKKHKVHYWLDSGSLLIAYRESHLYDDDLDISAWQTDIDQVIRACEELKTKGFQIKYQSYLCHLEDHIQLFVPEQFNTQINHIDFYLYHKLGDEAVVRNIHRPIHKSGRFLLNLFRRMKPFSKWCSERVMELHILTSKSIWFVVPSRYFENLKTFNVMGLDFNISDDTSSYLEYRYGKAWIKPNPNWRMADGEVIRYRPLRLISKSQRVYRHVVSDVIKANPHKIKRGLFQFTESENAKIRGLG